MNHVRVKDLALVAVAGGLLAFELVSIGEALPNVKRAIADRGWSGNAKVVSASAAAVALPAVEPAAPTTSKAVAGAVRRHVHRLAAATSSASSKSCAMATRAKNGQRRGRLHVVTIASDGSCAAGVVAQTVVRRREIQKAVDLALKQTTL